MRLSIRHQTVYHYQTPIDFSVLYLRLTPTSNRSQRVMRWALEAPGHLHAWVDGFGNLCHTLTLDEPRHEIDVTATGDVETGNVSGVLPEEAAGCPIGVFVRETRLTRADEPVAEFAETYAERIAADRIEGLHALMAGIGAAVEYRPGSTGVHSSASEVLADGAGVCQDHSHVFIACCRHLGIPARYVSGYLYDGPQDEAYLAGHAWAAAWVPDLGWVSFDVANQTSGTERHVGVAIALDYEGATPVRGVQRGGGAEGLSVQVQVSE